MSKAFLSHNSFDKDFVEKVFQKLGAARAIYDKITFKKNCDLSDQIRDGLEDADVYVLFLSSSALQSNWVTNEIDLANELKTKWKINKFLIFQLDDTNWSELPKWMSRYVVSCPPSPEHVALRIQDELRSDTKDDFVCYGRDVDVRTLTEEILDRDFTSFLFLSGPNGIGRRTLAKAVYRNIFKDVSSHNISIELDDYADIDVIYRNILAYSSNWRAYELVESMQTFGNFSDTEKIREIARLIYEITVGFRQVLIFDIGRSGFDVNGKLIKWLSKLMSFLQRGDYPYVLFLASRYASNEINNQGLFYSVNPLDEEDSKYIFKLLLNSLGIKFPSKTERDHVESCLVGHPGLIATVVNYLRLNPNYKPTRTHNNIVLLINAEVERMMQDFLQSRPEVERYVALFAEAYIISYEEIIKISEEFHEIVPSVDILVDAGFVIYRDGYYQLAPYVQHYAQTISQSHFESLGDIRKILFDSTGGIEATDFIPIQLLDSRIVEHFLSNVPVPGYLKNLVMPAQLLKAARKHYDNGNYPQASKLAHEAFELKEKLSENGTVEAWRLIGLSAIRTNNTEEFKFFNSQYTSIPSIEKKESVYWFAQGFQHRYHGNLRDALDAFKKIETLKLADQHVYRELAYIYAFEGTYDEATRCISKAVSIAQINSYILDVQAFVLIERYRRAKGLDLASQIEDCLEKLMQADSRDGTHFYQNRSALWDIVGNGRSEILQQIFTKRNSLPIHARTALLDLLSAKGKNQQYEELGRDLSRAIRETGNQLAEIEKARVDVRHLAMTGQTNEARILLGKYRNRFTNICCSNLEQEINFGVTAK